MRIFLIFILLIISSCHDFSNDRQVVGSIDSSYYDNAITEEMSSPLILEKTIIDDIVKEGDINFVLQDTMIVGIVNEINMTISINVDKSKIISDINTFNEFNLKTDTIRISPLMRARLIDPTDEKFKIQPKTSEEQFLEYNDYTIWTWNVIPLEEGNNELSLVVDIIYDNRSKTIKSYDDIIYVHSDKSMIDKILYFIEMNWQYFLSTLVIPLLIWLFNKRKKI